MRNVSIFRIWIGGIVFSLLYAGCQGRSGEGPPIEAVYDSVGLVDFVQSASTQEKGQVAFFRLDSILARCAGNREAFSKTVVFLERRLADPNSVYRNEALYSKLLTAELSSPWVTLENKKRLRAKLDLASQNCEGSFANDFSFITPQGRTFRLYGLRARFTLIFFYNPECEACKQMKEALQQSGLIQQLIRRHRLRLLAVYTDRDLEVWKKHLPEQPPAWLQGRDDNEFLYRNGVYDLRAIPTLYLLDSGKRVLIKDALDVTRIEEVLRGDK